MIVCLIAVSVSSEVVCVAMGAIGRISSPDESHLASWRFQSQLSSQLLNGLYDENEKAKGASW